MQIAILSRNAELYSTRRLKEACESRGHHVDVLNTQLFAIHVERAKPSLLYNNKPIPRYDAIIPRIGASITFFGTAVVRQFEQMGVFSLNSAASITSSRDKLRASQVLSRHDIGIPDTIFARQKGTARQAIEAVGGAPVVIKLLEGTQGMGVILAETTKTAEAIVEAFHSADQNVLIQKFVKESKGRDFRAFVVGGHVVAAMKRQAAGDEFRSNVHRGGAATAIELSEEYKVAAVHAAQIMGLHVAGVDMLEGNEGPILMEVNSSPGLEGIETSTGLDVAGVIADFIEQQVLFPEIDLRQRLTLGRGYGVAEIKVHEDSELKDKTVHETRLRERDIVVLSLTRGDQTIPNPRPDRTIYSGDTLLCFGKMLAMRSLLQLPFKAGQASPPDA
jgi:ribosomal protein S6--L-glutamate ligase